MYLNLNEITPPINSLSDNRKDYKYMRINIQISFNDISKLNF